MNGNNDSDKPVAWITGSGSRRVGRTIARRFADAGYRVALHANHSIQEAQATAQRWHVDGIDAMVTAGPIEETHTSRDAIQSILKRWGHIDVLVHSAAIWDWKPFEEITPEDIRRQLDVNTLGAFLCSQHAGLQMIQQPNGGSIVLIGDWATARPYRDFAAYFVGKGSIQTMTRSLAIELASRNPSIRVNAILPGPVMLAEDISETKAETIRNQSLLKRHGRPEDVAEAALFLATQPFITGVCLPVDGGRTIYAGDVTDQIAHPTFE